MQAVINKDVAKKFIELTSDKYKYKMLHNKDVIVINGGSVNDIDFIANRTPGPFCPDNTGIIFNNNEHIEYISICFENIDVFTLKLISHFIMTHGGYEPSYYKHYNRTYVLIRVDLDTETYDSLVPKIEFVFRMIFESNNVHVNIAPTDTCYMLDDNFKVNPCPRVNINCLKNIVFSVPSNLPEPADWNNYNPISFTPDDYVKFLNDTEFIKASVDYQNEYVARIKLNSPFSSNIAHLFILKNGCASYLDWYDTCYSNFGAFITKVLNGKPVQKVDTSKNILKNNINQDVITMDEIENISFDDGVKIPTGFNKIDNMLYGGLERGTLTILLGASGSGKSTIVNQICLNAVENDQKVFLATFELKVTEAKRWLFINAAGSNHVKEGNHGMPIPDYYSNHFITCWLHDKFALYNNFHSNDWVEVEKVLTRQVENGFNYFVLDNMMALNIKVNNTDNELQSQTQFVNKLRDFAQLHNVVVVLVVHPNKSDKCLITSDNISGSQNIKNVADTILIIHRVSDYFKTMAQKEWKWPANDDRLTCDNLLELSKNRYGGQTEFTKLYFEYKTKRMKQSQIEHKVYPWDTFGNYENKGGEE